VKWSRRLGPEEDMLMLLTAISDAVERYDPEREAVVMIQTEKGFEVSIATPTGCEPAGGLFYDPSDVASDFASIAAEPDIVSDQRSPVGHFRVIEGR
jgi:hypothetical protein